MEERLKLFLRSMVSNHGSDLHIKSGAIPRVRIHGKLKVLGKSALSAEMVEEIAKSIISEEQYSKL